MTLDIRAPAVLIMISYSPSHLQNLTDRLTGVGAGDATASKNQKSVDFNLTSTVCTYLSEHTIITMRWLIFATDGPVLMSDML